MAKILVLDDMLDAANLVRRILTKKGHEVFAFTDGVDALIFARDNRVDLAILDIKLKGSSGVDVLADLKKIVPSLRAIMLTGYPTAESARASMAAGACRYCVKPIDNEELEDTVATVLSAPMSNNR